MKAKIKVSLLIEEGYIRDSVRLILSITENLVLAGETENIDTCLDIVKNYAPDIIIVGEEVKGNDGFMLSEQIIQENPFQPIILISSKPNVDTYRKALHIGIREVLKTPLRPEDVKNAIYRVYETKVKTDQAVSNNNGFSDSGNEVQKVSTNNKGRAQIISMFSIKGGVGKTTIATNLAVSLMKSNKKIALLDLDIYSGDIALAMNVIPKRRITDFANDINRLDMDLLESYMVKHSSGVMVLAAPFSIEHADYIKPEHIEKILSILKQEYDYIIIDCPSYFYDIALMALENSNFIFLVATMDILSLKSVKNTISVLENLNIDKTKFNLILNQYIKGVGLTLNDVEATLSLPMTSIIPLDHQSVISSINQGAPFVSSMKRSKVAKAIQNLAKEISIRAGDVK